MSDQKNTVKLAGFENLTILVPLMSLAVIGAIYYPAVIFALITFSILYMLKLMKYVPFIILLLSLLYAAAINQNPIYSTLLLNGVFCSLPLVYSLMMNNKYDLFSPYIITPALYFIFFCTGPAVLQLEVIYGFPIYDTSLLIKLGHIYTLGILLYYFGLHVANQMRPASFLERGKSKLSDFNFKTLFKYYLVIHFISLVYFLWQAKSFPLLMANPYQARIDVIAVVSGYVLLYSPKR